MGIGWLSRSLSTGCGDSIVGMKEERSVENLDTPLFI